jgi:hypothetical protein
MRQAEQVELTLVPLHREQQTQAMAGVAEDKHQDSALVLLADQEYV